MTPPARRLASDIRDVLFKHEDVPAQEMGAVLVTFLLRGLVDNVGEAGAAAALRRMANALDLQSCSVAGSA
jgi:hypothetical protein